MQTISKQQGIALLMLVFVLVIVASAYTLKALNSAEIQDLKVQKTAEALSEAKSALIGWSVSHPVHPGIMPFPDRSTDGNYDGNSDCTSSSVINFHLLIGRLPFLGQTAPCAAASPGVSSNLVDGNGEQLWYAVSSNLLRTSTVPIVNPSIITTPDKEWLVVRDKSGNVVSERVAAVIIAPGNPVGTQARSSGLAGPQEYLDSINISGTVYANYDYSVSAEDFIMAEDMKYIRETDTKYTHPYNFNDRLVYITIDELMVALEKRVLAEMAVSLRSYYTNSAPNATDRYFPYAATLGGTGGACIDGLRLGQVPIADCTTVASSYLPPWITDNKWHEHIYYALSSDCSLAVTGCTLGGLTVGLQANVHALLVSAGAVLGSQSRPSATVSDYLDSIENTDGDDSYDAVGTVLTNNYNDQMLIVAP